MLLNEVKRGDGAVDTEGQGFWEKLAHKPELIHTQPDGTIQDKSVDSRSHKDILQITKYDTQLAFWN